MISEKEYVIDAFEKHFSAFSDKPLVIYGIGKTAEYIIESFKNFKIIGLMDGQKSEGEIYGKPIISKEQLLESGVKDIIIASTAANTKIIYRRIASLCKENSIKAYGLNGKLLGEKDDNAKCFDKEKYANINKSALISKIESADIISFDVFDTVIMRRVLYPHDVFLFCQKLTTGGGNGIDSFYETRIEAEKQLYAEGVIPNIGMIYERIGKLLDLSGETIHNLKDIEIKTEKECLIRREEMFSVFCGAVCKNKKIVFTSDMYLPQEILKDILNNLGFPIKNVEFFVSCDYGVAKRGGLFGVLRKKYPVDKILHIGDNAELDGRFAKEYGIDDTFLIESAVSMLEDSYISDLFKYEDGLDNRLVIGEFISKQLNSPFIFGETDGKLKVSTVHDFAYSFIAPLVHTFLIWLIEKSRELELDCILFSSRDGYLFYNIYQAYKNVIPNAPEAIYFYTSRAFVRFAGLKSDDDILCFSRAAFDGAKEELLKTRFYLSDDEIKETNDGETLDSYVLRHRDIILKRSSDMRDNYFRYFKSLNCGDKRRFGFMDFIGAGTCQNWTQKIFNIELYGMYFGQSLMRENYNHSFEINSLYGLTTLYEEKYNLFKDFLFLENIFTSSEAMLVNFDKFGKPIFSKEYRTKEQIESLKNSHFAVFDYIKQTKIDINKANISKELPKLIFHFLSSEFSDFAVECLSLEKFEDTFFNCVHEIPSLGEN